MENKFVSTMDPAWCLRNPEIVIYVTLRYMTSHEVPVADSYGTSWNNAKTACAKSLWDRFDNHENNAIYIVCGLRFSDDCVWKPLRELCHHKYSLEITTGGKKAFIILQLIKHVWFYLNLSNHAVWYVMTFKDSSLFSYN